MEKSRNIHDILLSLIENEFHSSVDYKILCKYLDELKNRDDQYELISFLHLLSEIATNHHSGLKFIDKFEQILKKLSNNIAKKILNSEIFNIFQDNKRILLFLFEEKILIMDQYIINKITKFEKFKQANYAFYFLAEIKSLKHEKWLSQYVYHEIINKELPENFYELRKEGQNDSYICKLIRNDSVVEFIEYVNRSNYPLQSLIGNSIYETNPYLNKTIKPFRYEQKNYNEYHQVTLIDYAAFFGSLNIFKYLQLNGVEIKPYLLIFAIHGKNAELIHLLREYKSENDIYFYHLLTGKCIEESIKCHHNDIANHFVDNWISNIDKYSFLRKSLKFYNFSFLPNEITCKSMFYICKYDYCLLLNILLNEVNVDIKDIQYY